MDRLNRWVIGATGLLMASITLSVTCSSQPDAAESLAEMPPTATEEPPAAVETLTTRPTATSTPSFTPSLTWTPSISPTPSVTRTPTLTRTPLPTVTPTPRHVDDAIWYADSSMAVYTRSDNLCVWHGGQTATYLADAAWIDSVQLSTDGEVIAFLQTRSNDVCRGPCGFDELWAVRRDGTGMRLLLTGDNVADDIGITHNWFLRILQWEWIPHTHLIALTTGVPSHGVAHNNDLQLVDVDAITRQYLLPPGEGGGVFFPSPDGRQIAVVTPDSISLTNIDGSNWRANLLSYDVILTWSEYNVFAWPVWMPDSSGFWIAIPPPGGESPSLTPSYRLTTTWYVTAATLEVARLADSELEWRGRGRENTVFSPNGSAIALIPWYSGSEMWVFSADGSEEIGHYSLGERMGFVRWEPDSEHFIVWVDERYNLQRVGLDGDVEPLYALDGMPVTSLPACAPDSE